MTEVRARLASNGRLVIPAIFRRALGLKSGDEIVIRLDGDEVRIHTPAAAVDRAKRAVRARVRGRQRLSDRLIAERRAEARHG